MLPPSTHVGVHGPSDATYIVSTTYPAPDDGRGTAYFAVPEADASLIRVGEGVALKLNPYPTRLFRGKVMRPGSQVRQEGEDRWPSSGG